MSPASLVAPASLVSPALRKAESTGGLWATLTFPFQIQLDPELCSTAPQPHSSLPSLVSLSQDFHPQEAPAAV